MHLFLVIHKEVNEMKRNPVTPYILIFILGIVLVFFLSIKGLNDSKEMAKEKKGGGANTEQQASAKFDPEGVAKSTCASCHGQNLEGNIGPNLHGIGKKLSEAQIKNIVVNGKGNMPKGVVAPENADAMAKYVMSLK
jgi:cytochrome c550